MLKIRDSVDLKELEKFGFSIIPEGIYAKSIKKNRPMMDADLTETFIAVFEDRTLHKIEVWSYYHIVYNEKEKHLFRFQVKDLIQAELIEKVSE